MDRPDCRPVGTSLEEDFTTWNWEWRLGDRVSGCTERHRRSCAGNAAADYSRGAEAQVQKKHWAARSGRVADECKREDLTGAHRDSDQWQILGRNGIQGRPGSDGAGRRERV